jgi:hypothetical protein
MGGEVQAMEWDGTVSPQRYLTGKTTLANDNKPQSKLQGIGQDLR